MEHITLTIPDMGTDDAAEVIEILINEGDDIQVEDGLIVLESEKATMDVPAKQAGKVTKILASLGQKLKVGDPVCEIAAAEKATTESGDNKNEKDETAVTEPSSSEQSTEETKEPPEQAIPEQTMSEPTKQAKPAGESPTPANRQNAAAKFHASPSIRAFARTLGVSLSQVSGSGHKGRIVREDVEKHIKQTFQTLASGQHITASAGETGIPAIPTIDFSKFGETTTQPLSRIKKISGKHLHAAWLNVPHVTQFDEADITELETFRKTLNARPNNDAKITILVFIMKAVAHLLRAMPEFNASINTASASLILKDYVNIGVAVDTPNGLVVPVIRDVDSKGVEALCIELKEISEKARAGKLSPADLSGGNFSISSLGGIGGSHFTPIVNAPEVAILGVGKSSIQPSWDGNAFQPRLMLPVSLSYDHRVIDGAMGARFTNSLRNLLQDIRQLLL